MENDESAESFDQIVCQSGQFGFFQKRLFLINTLIQSACISVLLYTCTCMPEVDEPENDPCAKGSDILFISNNGYHYSNDTGANDTNITMSVGFQSDSTIGPSALTSIPLDRILYNITTIVPILTNNTSLQSTLQNISSVSKLLTNDAFKDLTENSTNSSPTTPSHMYYESGTDSTDSPSPVADASGSFNSSSTLANITSISVENITNILQNVTEFRTTTEYLPALPKVLLNYTAPKHLLPPGQPKFDGDVSDEVIPVEEIYPTFQGITDSTTGDMTASYNENLTSSHSVTSSDNSTLSCRSTFILLRLGLRRTQILENLSLQELVQVTSYAQAIGFILGAVIGSLIADMYGRRRLMYVSLAAMLFFHCLVALSISWIMFIFLRTVAVGCAGATIVVSFVIVIEYLGPDFRDACTCSCFWTLGAILMSVETLVTSHWRWLAVLSGGICLPVLGGFFTSHESVRWFQCQHRFTDAENGFREVVSVNSAAVPDIMALLDQSRACVVNNMHHKRFTFLDLFHSLDSTKWTVALVYTCMISSCVYFCLLWRVKNVTGLVYIDGFLPFLLDLPLTWSVIVVNRCLGRRWCLFLYAVASGFALLSVLILYITGNVDNMPSLVTGLSLFGKIGVTASLSLIFLVAIEMYPTVTR